MQAVATRQAGATRCAARWRSALPAQRPCPRRAPLLARSAAEPALAAAAAAHPKAEIAEKLSAEQLQEWAACMEQLQQVGLTPEEADRFTARAFGWSSQVYWLNSRVSARVTWARRGAARRPAARRPLLDGQAAALLSRRTPPPPPRRRTGRQSRRR
jgi:hypothetical protein